MLVLLKNRSGARKGENLHVGGCFGSMAAKRAGTFFKKTFLGGASSAVKKAAFILDSRQRGMVLTIFQENPPRRDQFCCQESDLHP